jgi:hypothetical protein
LGISILKNAQNSAKCEIFVLRKNAQNSAKCAEFRIRSAKQRKIGQIWTRKNSAKTERKNAQCTSLPGTHMLGPVPFSTFIAM